MIRVMIVEDEKPILDLMERLVRQQSMLEVVGAFTNPILALEQYSELKPDAAFLDVEMPRLGGIELADKLKVLDEELQVVFTTAYPDYAVEAFRVSAVDYLLKPVTSEALEKVVVKLMKNQALHSARQHSVLKEEPRVRCLGTFETRGPDGSLISWPTRKTEEMFAYFLAYPNRVLGKWHLADLLWPDLDEDRALHNVHNTVYRLKKVLKDTGIDFDLNHTNEGYHLKVTPSFTDLERFRGFMKRTVAIDQWNVAEADRLLRSYNGSLFGSKGYAWSAGLVAEISAQQASLCRMVTLYYLGIRNRIAAKEMLRIYLSCAPLDEAMTEELLRLYANDGETALFRTYYELYVKQLEIELGLEPSEEIREIAARLLSEDMQM